MCGPRPGGGARRRGCRRAPPSPRGRRRRVRSGSRVPRSREPTGAPRTTGRAARRGAGAVRSGLCLSGTLLSLTELRRKRVEYPPEAGAVEEPPGDGPSRRLRCGESSSPLVRARERRPRQQPHRRRGGSPAAHVHPRQSETRSVLERAYACGSASPRDGRGHARAFERGGHVSKIFEGGTVVTAEGSFRADVAVEGETITAGGGRPPPPRGPAR